ncbi:MAG: glycosyltransferase family 2 protein [bacterium]|nr:glycosyltransferase family 2 protein [bacterium]
MPKSSQVDVSIVIPVYFNEGCLKPTIKSLHDIVLLAHPDKLFEVIFVDDGSGDRSFDELLAIRSEYGNVVRVIKLTRNFGQVNAIIAGLERVRGQCAVFMSADGQDPPALINDMLRIHEVERFHVVVGERRERDEGLFRTWTSHFFYELMRRLSYPNIPSGGFDFALLSKHVVEVMLRNLEAHLFLQGHILWTGYKIKVLPYRRSRRITGRSRWTFWRRITYLIDGSLSQSYLPLRAISSIGMIFSILGALYACVVIASKLWWGNPVQGWTPLMVMILVMGGLQMVMLGVIGEYLWRTLAQSRRRDLFVVESVHED